MTLLTFKRKFSLGLTGDPVSLLLNQLHTPYTFFPHAFRQIHLVFTVCTPCIFPYAGSLFGFLYMAFYLSRRYVPGRLPSLLHQQRQICGTWRRLQQWQFLEEGLTCTHTPWNFLFWDIMCIFRICCVFLHYFLFFASDWEVSWSNTSPYTHHCFTICVNKVWYYSFTRF